MIKNKTYGKIIDRIVLAFTIANLVSLLFADRIYEQITIRCLITSTAMFFILRKYSPTDKQKIMIIHWLGGFTVFIAGLSILQMIFPDTMNTIAYKYFSSKDTYGLLNDFNRGRLLHWGSIILSFPFFYASYALLQKQCKRMIVNLYGICGFSIIFLSMIASNFRWTAFVFVVVSVYVVFQLTLHKFLSKKNITYGIAMVCLMAIVGLIFSTTFLGYNMLDRILITNPDRDWNEGAGRLQLFNQALGVFLGSPIFGVGIGNYLHYLDQYNYIRYFSIHDQVQYITAPAAAHNEFLTVLSESGIIGLVLFVLFVYITMRESYKRMRLYHGEKNGLTYLYPLLIFSSYLSFCLYVMFENIYPHNYLYIFSLSGILFSWFSIIKEKT